MATKTQTREQFIAELVAHDLNAPKMRVVSYEEAAALHPDRFPVEDETTCACGEPLKARDGATRCFACRYGK